jgi:plastocyanin
VKTLRPLTVAVAVGATLLTACADDGPQPIAAAQPAQSPATTEASAPELPTVTVQSIDNTFRPDRIEVAPGTEVVWVNRGRNEHDILSDFGFGVTAADFQPGDEYRHVFTEPGEYPYHCTIHGTETVGMIGTIVVTDEVA